MPRTMTASHAYKTVATAAERIANDAPATIESMSIGDVVRQGDLYILMLDGPILGGKPIGRQLAPGTSQGSRHVAVGDCKVFAVDEKAAVAVVNRLVPATKDQSLFIGPMIVAGGPLTLDHPEHANLTLPGESTYLVTYQRTWANEIRRTLD
jgi:hypothetical protein